MEILYHDQTLLVVNKPAGLSTLPDGYNPSLPNIRALLEKQFGRVWVVHRLDKQTSGVLLFALNADAHRSLNTQFEQHGVLKIYHALVMGSSPTWDEQIISLPLHPNGDRRHRTIIDILSGKPAVTRFKVLKRFCQFSLLEAAPETGRPHQIRAHLSSLGLYILGDELYVEKKNKQMADDKTAIHRVGDLLRQLAGGMALHAKVLEINHPSTGERLRFQAPYSPQLNAVLDQLSQQTISSTPAGRV